MRVSAEDLCDACQNHDTLTIDSDFKGVTSLHLLRVLDVGSFLSTERSWLPLEVLWSLAAEVVLFP